MAAAGERVRAHKPVVTGLDERSETGWPPDHELLANVAGMTPEEVAPLRYGPAVSPHLAARLAGEAIDPADLIARARVAAGTGDGILIVEGVGGLLVPLTDELTVRDLAVALGLGVLIAAAPGLGTINHTLLSIDAARSAGLDVRAVVLTPVARDSPRSWNAPTATRSPAGRGRGRRTGSCANPDLADLARAGAKLPWRRWLQRSSFP